MAKPESTEEDPLILETRWLMGLKPIDRLNYVNQMINSLTGSIKQIAQQINEAEGLGKLNLANILINKFMKDLDENYVTLIPPIEYAVKAEFRPAFHRFLEDLSKLFK